MFYLVPVSYTHLDVYKRQPLHCHKCFILVQSVNNITSKDVYKRQLLLPATVVTWTPHYWCIVLQTGEKHMGGKKSKQNKRSWNCSPIIWILWYLVGNLYRRITYCKFSYKPWNKVSMKQANITDEVSNTQSENDNTFFSCVCNGFWESIYVACTCLLYTSRCV